jgi:hypothetical protein
MRGYEVFALSSSHLGPSHAISYHLVPTQPIHPSIPAGALRTDTLDHAFIYTSTHPHLLTSKRRSPTYPPTHGRADRAQEFPNDDAVKPARARNEGCSRADEPRRRDPSHRVSRVSWRRARRARREKRATYLGRVRSTGAEA